MGSRDRVRSRDIDGGWAWIVLSASVMYTIIHVGSLRSFGVLHIELLELFGESDSRTGLVSFTLNLVATCVALPAGMMADRYSPRIIVMVGAFFAALGIGLTAVAPNLDMAIVTMGAMTGAGIEFVAVTTIITLNKYFCKRRALANGIAMAGASLGNLVLPPLIEIIVQEYAFRGTIIILSGLWANLLVVGAVLRPIKVDTSGLEQDPDEKEPLENDCKEIKKEKSEGVSENATNKVMISITEVKDNNEEDNIIKPSEKDQPATGTLFQSSHVIMGSCHSLTALDKVVDTKQQQLEEKNVAEKQTCCGKNKGNNNEICELMKNPSIIQIGFMVAMGCLSIFTGLYTLPLLAHEIGETKIRGSLLLSIAGGCDLVSRIILGLISDLPRVNKPMVVKISFLLCGVLGLVLCSFRSFFSLGALAVVLGCLGSNHMLLLGPILIDTVGAQKLGAAMGLVSIPMGLATAIGPPLLGAVKEATGTYYAAARILSLCFIIGFLVYFVDRDLIRVCKTWCGKLKQKESQNTQTTNNKAKPLEDGQEEKVSFNV